MWKMLILSLGLYSLSGFGAEVLASHKCPQPPSFEFSKAVKPPFLYSITYTVTNLPLGTFSAAARSSNSSGCGDGHPSDQFYKPAGVSYLEDTLEQVAEESSRGQGDYLEALARLAGCPATTFPVFSTALHTDYARLFVVSEMPRDQHAAQVWQAITQLIATHPELSQSCTPPS